MRYLKLFESFTNDKKIFSAELILAGFILNERFKRLKKIEDEEGNQYYYFDFGLNIPLSKPQWELPLETHEYIDVPLLIFCSSDPNKKAQVDFDFIAKSSYYRGDAYPSVATLYSQPRLVSLQVRALQKIINRKIEPWINWDHKIKFLQIKKNI